jgi:hypothetical protein
MARGVVLVDVLDCEDGIIRIEGGGFLNTACGPNVRMLLPIILKVL